MLVGVLVKKACGKHWDELCVTDDDEAMGNQNAKVGVRKDSRGNFVLPEEETQSRTDWTAGEEGGEEVTVPM